MKNQFEAELLEIQRTMLVNLAREIKARGTNPHALSVSLGASPNLITKLFNGDRKWLEAPLVARIAKIWGMRAGTLMNKLLKTEEKIEEQAG